MASRRSQVGDLESIRTGAAPANGSSGADSIRHAPGNYRTPRQSLYQGADFGVVGVTAQKSEEEPGDGW